MMLSFLSAALTMQVAVCKEKLIFLCAGQSQAVGHGSLNELPQGYPQNSVTNFTNAWTWVHDATDPIDSPLGQWDWISRDNIVGTFVPGAGPCLAFANELAGLFPDNEIVIVPAAKDGSTIRAWQKMNLAVQRDTLYGSLLGRANYVRNFGSLAGMLWIQGSGDAWHLYDAVAYQSRTERFFSDLRADLNRPDFKIVYAQEHPVPPSSGYVGWTQVRDAQAAMQGVNNIMITVPSSCARPIDNIHYNTACLIDLGTRAARAWRDAVIPQKVICGP